MQSVYSIFKKLWNMRVTLITIVAGPIGTVPKDTEKIKEIKGRIKTIQTAALLKSVRILRKVLEMWEAWIGLQLKTTS